MKWTTLAVAATTALAAGLAWCVWQSPLTLYDGLGPILDSSRVATAKEMFQRALHTPGYLRPLRLAQIKAVYDLSPVEPTTAFKIVHVVLIGTAFLLFALFLRPRTRQEAIASLIALTVFAGHHSLFMLLGEAYPINHFLEMVVLALFIGLLARGAPRWWKDLAAVVVLVIALATLESGLLVATVLVTCWLVGWRGISGRGVMAGMTVVAAYFWIRFGVLEIPSPGLDERAAGWGVSRLEPEEIVARFQANPLPFYAYNVISAFLDVVLSQPRNGTWIIGRRWIDDDVAPWLFVHLAASLLVTSLIAMAAVRALRRWWSGELEERDRFVLLGLAVVCANAMVSFGYVKDDVLSIASTFYAAAAFAVVANLTDRVSLEGRRRSLIAALLIAVSLLWMMRTAGTFFSLRAFAYRTGYDWATFSPRRELPDDFASPERRELFERMRRENVRRGGTAPRLTNERDVQRWVEIQ